MSYFVILTSSAASRSELVDYQVEVCCDDDDADLGSAFALVGSWDWMGAARSGLATCTPGSNRGGDCARCWRLRPSPYFLKSHVQLTRERGR